MGTKTEAQRSLQSRPLAIGARIRELRQEKGLSQGDVERRTGLMRCYISRVENGFKSPSLRTVERFARALEVPLYRIFYAGEDPAGIQAFPQRLSLEHALDSVETRGPDGSFLRKLSSLWSRTGDFEHEILFDIAKRMAARAEAGSGPNTHEILGNVMRSKTHIEKLGVHRIKRSESEKNGNWS